MLSPDKSWYIIAIPEGEREWLELHLNAWKFRAALIDIKRYLEFNFEAGLDKDIKDAKKKTDVLQVLIDKIDGVCDGYEIKLP